MRTKLCVPLLLVFVFPVYSDGIIFRKGTWREILAVAKQKNLAVFVDFYTEWCGGCKHMDSTIFPLNEVGKVYNENFICWKIDAETDEGRILEKRYQVQFFPTFIFVKPNGDVLYKVVGQKSKEDFLKLAQAALDDYANPNLMSDWEKDYATRKNDPAFLYAYILKRAERGLSYIHLFDEFVRLLPPERLCSDSVVSIFKLDLEPIPVSSYAYMTILKNRNNFKSELLNSIENKLAFYFQKDIDKAVKGTDDNLFRQLMLVLDQIPLPVTVSKKEMYDYYYQQTGKNLKLE